MGDGIIAHVWSNGNEDTDLEGCETNLNTCLVTFNNDEHRTAVRRELERCFTQLWEEQAKVLFSDELSAK